VRGRAENDGHRGGLAGTGEKIKKEEFPGFMKKHASWELLSPDLGSVLTGALLTFFRVYSALDGRFHHSAR
jgi:hypothetical protein